MKPAFTLAALLVGAVALLTPQSALTTPLLVVCVAFAGMSVLGYVGSIRIGDPMRELRRSRRSGSRGRRR